MIAVLAEDRSDAQSLKHLIRRMLSDPRLPIKSKGFGGCGELLKKGPLHLALFRRMGCSRFVVCRDADSPDPGKARRELTERFHATEPAVLLVVPVEELEAWLIADEAAIRRVIPSLSIAPVPSPERLHSPKEWLIRESRRNRTAPLFVPPIHNEQIAMHLDLSVVAGKCPSFRRFADELRSG